MGKKAAKPKPLQSMVVKGKRLRLSKNASQVVTLRGGVRCCPECGCNLQVVNMTLALLSGTAQ